MQKLAFWILIVLISEVASAQNLSSQCEQGDDAYKKEWMRDRRERYGIIAYNLSTFSGVVGSVRQWGGEQLRRFTSFLKMLKRTYIDSDPGER